MKLAKLIFSFFLTIIIAGCQPNPPMALWYVDNDGDGYGNPAFSQTNVVAGQANSFVQNADDCDDSNANAHPGGIEIPDNDVDEDCNGYISITFYYDHDSDGFGVYDKTMITEVLDHNSPAPTNYAWVAGDCWPDHPDRNPLANEIPNNGRDDNCDGEVDTFQIYIDGDGDGYGNSIITTGQGVHNREDCDDSNFNVHPYTIEIPNDGVDSNCDGADNT